MWSYMRGGHRKGLNFAFLVRQPRPLKAGFTVFVYTFSFASPRSQSCVEYIYGLYKCVSYQLPGNMTRKINPSL